MVNILLTAVGRRPYLVRWFQQALDDNHVPGRVFAADADPAAPARAFADDFIVGPGVLDETYDEWLGSLLQSHDVDLAISINDFELSRWATLPQTAEYAALVRVSSDAQSIVEDKLAMSARLSEFGVASPATWLGGQFQEPSSGSYVTKGRFGSASRGLRFVDGAELPGAITAAVDNVTDRSGVPALEQSMQDPRDLVVVQERVAGIEYGLDVVCDLGGKFATVLARRKISMRAGETDRAVTVDAEPFLEVAHGIAQAVPHPGTFDADVIVDSSGVSYVVDINPRFGGGYPFSHVAGARIPSAYVAWAAGTEPDPSWLRSEPGVVGGKYVEVSQVPGVSDGVV